MEYFMNVALIFLQSNTDYEIVVLEEEMIPLAGELDRSSDVLFYVGIVLIVFVIVLITCTYLFHCRTKRRRILFLGDKYHKEVNLCWNIGQLNKEMMRLELEAITKECDSMLAH